MHHGNAMTLIMNCPCFGKFEMDELFNKASVSQGRPELNFWSWGRMDPFSESAIKSRARSVKITIILLKGFPRIILYKKDIDEMHDRSQGFFMNRRFQGA